MLNQKQKRDYEHEDNREEGEVNITYFVRDLKASVKVTLDLLKQGINSWFYCIYFIASENQRNLVPPRAAS